MKQDKELLKLCRHLWEGMASFRDRRRTALDFTFGRQWQREITLPDGRITTEEREMRANGRKPITNNLTRQLIKTVVGKWRYLRSRHNCGEGVEDDALGRALEAGSVVDLADARALEEFLISGIAAQRIDERSGEGVNISPARLILSPFMCEDAADCRLMGILHDLHPAALMRRFGAKDATHNSRLAAILSRRSGFDTGVFGVSGDMRFDTPGRSDCVRVIEVWHRNVTGILRIHDPADGRYIVTPGDDKVCGSLAKLNERRSAAGRPRVTVTGDVADVWVHSWLTTSGHVLYREIMAERERPALVVRAYPMIDGEIHSLVEDIMPQQEYVNRLVQLLDDTLEHSAKGVLLYPTDQLPHGMTWEHLRKIWSTPGSIIPFMRNSKNITPIQISTNGTSEGASEMLRTQLDLFGRISGTSFATERQGLNANSADMLRRQMEQEAVALLDILSSFEAFLASRDIAAGKGVKDA